MCSKLISARAERSARTCSRPPQFKKGEKRNIPVGDSTPLISRTQGAYTVLLFRSPGLPAEVCMAPAAGVPPELQTPQGLHIEQLRKVFTRPAVYHYEWYWQARACRTTLLPLMGEMGQVTEVMGITQDISAWGKAERPHHALHEGGTPKTFAQLLLAARETEKREIAKALHDEIGTASIMLSALVGLAKQRVRNGDAQQALADLDRLQVQAQESMERLRSIIVTLRPPSLEVDGALRGSIQQLIEEVCKLRRLEYQFDCSDRMPEKGISDQVKILVYRIVQEALNNVVKHAHASRVAIALKRKQGQLYVSVQDNGAGFTAKTGRSIQHVGLLAMRNSVQLIGGKLTILSKPGQGTCISAVCPCVVYEETT